MIKLMQQADPQMNKSTKVHYLINGLLPSLSTENRRNYPTTTQEFLKQVKITEELTALNTIFASNSVTNDDLASDTAFLYPASKPTSKNDSKNSFRHYNDNYNYIKKPLFI